MEFPCALPPDLDEYKQAKTDIELFLSLQRKPELLITFFELVTEDEGWCFQHSALMGMLINWLTQQYFFAFLSYSQAMRIVKKIWRHQEILLPLCPKNVLFTLEELSVPINSLLWGVTSPLLRVRMQEESAGQTKKELRLQAMQPVQFNKLNDYVETGSLAAIWQESPGELLEFLKFASDWQMEKLSIELQNLLKKQIDLFNIADWIKKSQEWRWDIIRQACCEIVNAERLGVTLFAKDSLLGLKFESFNEKSLLFFERIKRQINALAFHQQVPDEKLFHYVISEVKELTAIDLSRTPFQEQFLQLPESLLELDLSLCSWLSEEHLQIFHVNCPSIRYLKLCYNVQLDYHCWSVLQEWHSLENIDLSYCDQIDDEELRLILEAIPSLHFLTMTGCKKVTSRGFHEIAQLASGLISLNVAYCSGMDDAALVEIVVHCKGLTSLNLTRCGLITERGVKQAIIQLPQLANLTIRKSGHSREFIKIMQEKYPRLRVIQ